MDLLLSIIEKKNGDIKARKVAVGSKKITYGGYDKSDGSYPTVNTDSVFLTGVIAAQHSIKSLSQFDI